MSSNLKREEAIKLLNTMRLLVNKGAEIINELERLLELDDNQSNSSFDILVKPGNTCRQCCHWNGSMCTVINRGCTFKPLI